MNNIYVVGPEVKGESQIGYKRYLEQFTNILLNTINNISKIAISICTLFVLPAKISELDLKYMSRLGLAYSF